jgi:hypothetical protein
MSKALVVRLTPESAEDHLSIGRINVGWSG